jgi:DNA-binding response OmpR family regulator
MSRILIVEDDETVSVGLQYALELEGFSVSAADNLNKAFKLFNEEQFELILLDVMLPDGNGYDLCKKIRISSKIPIIFLTACDEEVNVILGLDIGADDYITKPFRVRELISRIKAALRRTGAKVEVNEGIISSGEISVLTLEAKVLYKGNDVNLTPIEYKLLVTLMQNAMKTMTRNIILEKLWDVGGAFVDDNTLSVHIRRLREKLEDNPSEPKYITTVRGFGYKWNKDMNK